MLKVKDKFCLKSFTLIEMLIIVAVIAILVPGVFSLFDSCVKMTKITEQISFFSNSISLIHSALMNDFQNCSSFKIEKEKEGFPESRIIIKTLPLISGNKRKSEEEVRYFFEKIPYPVKNQTGEVWAFVRKIRNNKTILATHITSAIFRTKGIFKDSSLNKIPILQFEMVLVDYPGSIKVSDSLSLIFSQAFF